MKSIMIALGLTGIAIAVLLITTASSVDDNNLLDDDSYIPKPRA
ncbi:hypothetical protein [Pontibacter diazotrophicus]|nr:hypothetical protein [Pontibacter diazotrophicus]